MIGYIKSHLNFTTLKSIKVNSWEIFIDSDKNGKAVIVGEDANLANEFIFVDGHLQHIKKAQPKDGLTQLTLEDPLIIFDRERVYEGESFATLGLFLSSHISAIKRDTDTMFNLNWLTVNVSRGNIPFTAPVVEEDGIFNLFDYIQTARQNGITTQWTVNGERLVLAFGETQPQRYNVVMGNGNNTLISQSFSAATYSKCTVRQENAKDNNDAPTTYTERVYYLQHDGSAAAAVPNPRIDGKWKMITCAAEDNPNEAAQELFDDNKKSHKIEFYSDRPMRLYDVANILFENGFLFQAKVSQIKISSEDERVLFTCGELPTTLEDRLREAEKKNKEKNT